MGHRPSHWAPTSALKEVVGTSVTTVVSLTLLRAGQGERLAFAFANASAKRDIPSRFANALANANARSSPCSARRSVKLTTVVTLVTTTSFKNQGTRGCAMARLMSRFAKCVSKRKSVTAIYPNPAPPL